MWKTLLYVDAEAGEVDPTAMRITETVSLDIGNRMKILSCLI